MRNRTLLFAFAGLSAFLLGCETSQAQVTKQGTGYQFRMKFTRGQTIKYRLNASVPYPGQPKPITIASQVVQSVQSVSNGVAALNVKVGPTVLNGKTMTEAPITSSAKLNNLGKPIGAANGSAAFTTYPVNPVKVGGTWSSTVPLAGLGGSAAATFKLVGLKSVYGKQVAELAVTLKATGKQKATGGGTMLVLTSDGMPLKMSMTLKMADPQNAAKTMATTINVTRV
jgi:hypothetical protein